MQKFVMIFLSRPLLLIETESGTNEIIEDEITFVVSRLDQTCQCGLVMKAHHLSAPLSCICILEFAGHSNKSSKASAKFRYCSTCW